MSAITQPRSIGITAQEASASTHDNSGASRNTPLFAAAGIVDPTKVVRTALQNAASISGLLLTTEAAITELPEKKKGGPPMPGGDDYDY